MTLDVSPTLSVWALLKVNLTPSALKPRQSFSFQLAANLCSISTSRGRGRARKTVRATADR